MQDLKLETKKALCIDMAEDAYAAFIDMGFSSEEIEKITQLTSNLHYNCVSERTERMQTLPVYYDGGNYAMIPNVYDPEGLNYTNCNLLSRKLGFDIHTHINLPANVIISIKDISHPYLYEHWVILIEKINPAEKGSAIFEKSIMIDPSFQEITYVDDFDKYGLDYSRFTTENQILDTSILVEVYSNTYLELFINSPNFSSCTLGAAEDLQTVISFAFQNQNGVLMPVVKLVNNIKGKQRTGICMAAMKNNQLSYTHNLDFLRFDQDIKNQARQIVEDLSHFNIINVDHIGKYKSKTYQMQIEA